MTNNIKGIAIYGGSFDPPHIAHEEIINKSLKELDTDRLIVIPAYLNPLKTQTLLSPIQRFDLMQKLCDRSDIIVEDFEIKNNKPTTTYETIQYIKSKYNPKKIYLIIGEDNLSIWDRWHRADEILQECELVVASRDLNILKDTNHKVLHIDIDVSSTKLRAQKENIDSKYLPQKISKEIVSFLKQS